MGLNKLQERELAKMLFVQMGLSQKEVSKKVGVSEKTIGKWKSQENWESQKTILTATRSHIIKNLQRQMELLQLEMGDTLATSKQVDILVKLAASIKSLEKETGLSETIDIAMQFINFLQPQDPELARKLSPWFDLFIKSKING